MSSLRLLGLTLVLTAALLVLVASSASAATSRAYQSRLTEAGSPAAPFTAPAGLAVDGSNNLYVVDSQFAVGPGLIDKFGPTGTFLAQSAGEGHWNNFIQNIAYSDASSLLYIEALSGGNLLGLNPDLSSSGVEPVSGSGGCCVLSIAVDNSSGGVPGAIYASPVASGRAVARLNAAGAPLNFTAGADAGTNELTGPFTHPGSVAVDPRNGNLYVAETGAVYEFESSGRFVQKFTAGGPTTFGEITALAVDPTTGNLLVAEATTVYELSPTGAFEGKLTAAAGAPFGHILGLAVDSTGTLYVSDSSAAAVDVFGPPVLVLTATTGPTSNLTDTTATLSGTVNDAATTLTGCRFEYVSEAAFQATGFTDLSSGGSAECSPAVAAIPADSVDHPVHADIAGLTPGVVYRYRLLAANATEENIGAARSTPAIIAAESVSDVSAGSAELEAEINPNGAATSYHFEYLTQAAYEQDGGSFSGPTLPAVVPIPDGTIPAGESPVVVAQSIAGLSPATAYRYRVAATSSLATVHGPALAFTTQAVGALVLPDDRGWELVTPPNKFGGLISPITLPGIVKAAGGGGAITYISNSPIEAEPQGSAGSQIQALSTRGPTGWVSRNIAIPHQHATGGPVSAPSELAFFDEDLSAALAQPWGLLNPNLSSEASEQTPYSYTLGSCATNCYRPLVTAANVSSGDPFGEEAPCREGNPLRTNITTVCGPIIQGATPDLSHVVLLSAAPLVPGVLRGSVGETAFVSGSLYEWSAGQLQLVSVLPPNGSGEELPAPPGARLGSEFANGIGGRAPRAISTDGTRVFWSIGETAAAPLYVRDTSRGETVELDAAEEGCVTCESGGAIFQTASSDGSRVFFTDTKPLTEGSGASPFSTPPTADLYECALSVVAGKLHCELTDLTPPNGGVPADVLGNVLGVSSDGSSVYFVANGALASNLVDNGAGPETAAPGDCPPGESFTAGTSCNLYLIHNGTTSFLTRLSGDDFKDWVAPPESQPTRVSPNGGWFAFMSQRSITGYDNRDAATGRPDAEIFVQEASSGALRCASCDPTGSRPVGVEYGQLITSGGNPVLATVNAEWPSEAWVAALLPQSGAIVENGGFIYQGRYLSDSGRLFFNALGALVPQDSNNVGDVYQYEPPGQGTCTAQSATFSQRSSGCVGLISSGTSPESSGFLDASENGNDVFFLTGSRLTPKDIDNAGDIYDASVGGGEPQIVNPPACEGDACQTPAVPPAHPTPGTALLNGPGNVTVCPKGKVKKNGKCAAKQQKKNKKKHHKKSHKKHAKKKRTAGRKSGGGK